MRTRQDIVNSIFANAVDHDKMKKDLSDMVNLICYNIREGMIIEWHKIKKMGLK
jgi:hypothetical protein